jgi:Predicted pyrophosphatase
MSYKDFVNLKLVTTDKDTCTRLCDCADALHAVIGLAGEVGELLDALKRHIYYGQEFADIEEEMGDIRFYYTACLRAFGLEDNHVIASNCEKLNKRYKKGFTTDESVTRADIPAVGDTHPERGRCTSVSPSPVGGFRSMWIQEDPAKGAFRGPNGQIVPRRTCVPHGDGSDHGETCGEEGEGRS